MQRFKQGDRILILPKFSSLYPGTHGVVVAVMPDRFRPVFTEYTILFGDGSKVDLFEFQLLEDIPGYRLLIAETTFDSHPPQPSRRDIVPEQKLILQASAIDIDIKIQRNQFDASISGQIFERHTSRSVADASVSLMKLSTSISTATTDEFGIFTFRRVFRAKYNIHVLIPAAALRIFGTLTV